MNGVTFQEAIAELGEYGLGQIAELAEWLKSGRAQTPWRTGVSRLEKSWNARIAPSIIARGMADLLGVSTPRFGMRVYLPHGSFVNALRIGSLCNEVRKWAERDKELPPEKRVDREPNLPKETPATLFRKGECIGDCVLAVPERLREEFQTIARDFGRSYGEGRELVGTPYAKTARLSGMCAQAVCFMVTAHLHEDSRGVFGVPEITRYASEMERLETLDTGLTPREIARYFDRVGLSGVSINLNERLLEPRPNAEDTAKVKSPGNLPHGSALSCFNATARGYIRSGFPVLFLVDAGRMAGYPSPHRSKQVEWLCYETSIYKYNNVLPKKRPEHAFDEARPRGHVVVGIGYSGDEFLFHDPSCLPFMRATGQQLIEASIYLKQEPGKPQMTELDRYRPIPVTPRKIALLLADACEDPSSRGLLLLSHSLQKSLDQRAGKVSERFTPGELLLAKASNGRKRIVEFIKEVFGLEWPEALLEEWSTRFGDRWIWWQAWKERCEIWLWDAENKASSDPDDYLSVHIGRVRCTGADCRIEAQYTHPNLDALVVAPLPKVHRQPPEQVPPLTPIPGMRFGMISSFAVRGMDTWKGPCPGEYCDLYCFVQRDADRFLKNSPTQATLEEIQDYRSAIKRNHWRHRLVPRFFGIWPWQWKFRIGPSLGVVEPRCNVFRQLSALPCTNTQPELARNCVKQVASEIRAQLREFGNPPVEAMSSYFPESSSPSATMREDVARALSFLMHLAQELNRDRCDAGQFTLEIVAGNLTNGIWPAIPADDDNGEIPYVMNVRDQDVVMGNFLETLGRLVPAFETTKVRISIECEPGPLYLLGTWDSLMDCCDRINADNTLKKYCGLSADLAHWAFLKRVEASEIPASVLSMIQNLHVSDHADFGHFGDAMPFEVHDRQMFVDWLRLLTSQRTRFTGSVSGEFEAAPCADHVHEFARRLGIQSSLKPVDRVSHPA